ncbi:MAG TPA: sigma-70 family RNA polymerase sigma factor [Vicinamibacterales bacterium]|nr:sigma-70 family RNA polymerase sigma factor [Vicinamibacterales bacterium]
MSQQKDFIEIFAMRRHELVRYAGVVSGDAASAEDLVQEAWMRCDQTAAVEAVAQPVHLLWRILRNLAVDRSRRLAHERRTVASGESDRLLTVVPRAESSTEDVLIAREELARIQRVLDDLDSQTRAAFEMHRFEGAKLREIAAHLGISVTTAHERIARAMALIRQAVRDDA